jgi:hypothetical protein
MPECLRQPARSPKDRLTMPYARRDDSGKIIALLQTAEDDTVYIPVDHPDVVTFLHHNPFAGVTGNEMDQLSADMLDSDIKMIRVIEDVIDLLISKNIINLFELPQPAQEKILSKRGRRERLFGSGGSIIGDEIGLL